MAAEATFGGSCSDTITANAEEKQNAIERDAEAESYTCTTPIGTTATPCQDAPAGTPVACTRTF